MAFLGLVSQGALTHAKGYSHLLRTCLLVNMHWKDNRLHVQHTENGIAFLFIQSMSIRCVPATD